VILTGVSETSSPRERWDAAEAALVELRDLESSALEELFAAECRRDDHARLISTAEAARLLDVTPATVRERWRRGELRGYGSEVKLRFRRSDVLACFEVRPPRHRDAVTAARPAVRRSQRPAGRFKEKVRVA
jgi:hypothetical protein